MNQINTDRLLEDEHETLFYECMNSTMFINSLKEQCEFAVQREIDVFLDQYVEHMENEPNKTEKMHKESFNETVKKLQLAVEKIVNDITPAIRNYMAIPPNVTLPVDKLRKPSDANLDNIKLENEEIEKELIKEKTYSVLLNRKIEQVNIALSESEMLKTFENTESNIIKNRDQFEDLINCLK